MADDEVLGEDDAPEGARPVADEREEVGEGVVELVRADDRDGDDASRWDGQRMNGRGSAVGDTYRAVARSENM